MKAQDKARMRELTLACWWRKDAIGVCWSGIANELENEAKSYEQTADWMGPENDREWRKASLECATLAKLARKEQERDYQRHFERTYGRV